MPFQVVAGQQTHYVRRLVVPASRPPVVFIHGAGGTHQHWLFQIRDLAQTPTYAIDLPGHGQSQAPGRDSIQAYADWLIAFLDAVELEQAVLVGHSMGGGIALSAGINFPDRVVGLGLVATGARLRVMPSLLATIRQDPEAAVRAICSSAFGPEASPEMLRLGKEQMDAVPAGVLFGDFKACDDFDVMGCLAEIAAPTVVLCGTHDSMTPSQCSVYLRDHIRGAELHLVEGAGHMVMVERPHEVVRAVEAFLGSL